jgi:hypothetical protein
MRRYRDAPSPSGAWFVGSAAPCTGQDRFRQSVRVGVESNDRRRRVVVDVEFLLVKREQGNQIMASRPFDWTRTAISHEAEVIPNLNRAGRQARAFVVSRALGERGNVGDPPMPKSTARRSLRVVDADREALCARRGSRPRERRRYILTSAAPTIEGLLVGEPAFRIEVGASQVESMGGSSLCARGCGAPLLVLPQSNAPAHVNS